jgi:hypothetical protein
MPRTPLPAPSTSLVVGNDDRTFREIFSQIALDFLIGRVDFRKKPQGAADSSRSKLLFKGCNINVGRSQRSTLILKIYIM